MATMDDENEKFHDDELYVISMEGIKDGRDLIIGTGLCVVETLREIKEEGKKFILFIPQELADSYDGIIMEEILTRKNVVILTDAKKWQHVAAKKLDLGKGWSYEIVPGQCFFRALSGQTLLISQVIEDVDEKVDLLIFCKTNPDISDESVEKMTEYLNSFDVEIEKCLIILDEAHAPLQ